MRLEIVLPAAEMGAPGAGCTVNFENEYYRNIKKKETEFWLQYQNTQKHQVKNAFNLIHFIGWQIHIMIKEEWSFDMQSIHWDHKMLVWLFPAFTFTKVGVVHFPTLITLGLRPSLSKKSFPVRRVTAKKASREVGICFFFCFKFFID